MDATTVVLVGLVIFGANILEAMTGFGSAVAALPFLTMLIGLKTAVPLLSAVSVVITSYMLATNFKSVNWREYRVVALFVSLGLPVGIFAFSRLDEKNLKLILGLFVVTAAVRALVKNLVSENPDKRSGKSDWYYRAILFGGGVFQGAFASGGPLVVVYTSDKIKNKTQFRATMCAVWLTLNSVLTVKNYLTGLMTERLFVCFAAAIPFLAAGSALGIILHKKVSNKAFSIMINVVLMAAGLSMAAYALMNSKYT